MTYNLGEMLAHRADLAPMHEGFAGPDCRLTYGEVNARCGNIAAWLHANGAAPGSRIALLGKNSAALAMMLFGAAKADAVSVVLNWRLQAAELDYILQDSGADVLFYDAEFAPLANALRDSAGLRLCIRHGGGAGADADADFEAVSGDSGLPACPPARRRGDDPAVLMYTSGTTGKPKGAMLSHANFLAAGHGTSSTIDWFDSHRFLMVAPLFHIGGLMPLTTSVQKGTTVHFLPEFDPAAVWQVIAQERITTMMTVPAMAQALLMAAARTEVDASSLINVTCGASAVPQSVIEGFAAMGVSLQQVYGLTEVTGAVSFWKASMNPQKADSHGKPAYLNELKITDPQSGSGLPAGSRGEILCRGAAVFSGYWNNEDATREAFRDGWFRTGDIGFFDDEGFLYVVDRLKDLIISGGENVYPAEVEQVILAAEGVAETAVAARADEKWGEAPVAFVVRKPGFNVTAGQLTAHCARHLARFKCPKEVVFLDALPRNGVGKVLKTKLRAMLAD